MLNSLELYEALKEKLGAENAKKLIASLETLEREIENQKIYTEKGIPTNLEGKLNEINSEIKLVKETLRGLEERIKLLENRFGSLENRIWWIVGLILVQWLSLMGAILLKH